jgi:hypothetical protein
MEKTPDEIKKGLECSDCRNCPYADCGSYEECMVAMAADAMAYIQQLEAAKAELLTKVEQLEAKCHQLERERDAAVRDCGCFPCQTCEERENGDLCPMCEIQGGYRKFHQWRGVKEE